MILDPMLLKVRATFRDSDIDRSGSLRLRKKGEGYPASWIASGIVDGSRAGCT
jgi:hypothetical protein